jgi:hypothetical protein
MRGFIPRKMHHFTALLQMRRHFDGCLEFVLAGFAGPGMTDAALAEILGCGCRKHIVPATGAGWTLEEREQGQAGTTGWGVSLRAHDNPPSISRDPIHR